METLKIRLFGLLKVPIILFTSPSVIEVNDQRCEVRIPLGYRTKNHVGSMYFGSLAVGADLCVGMLAMEAVKSLGAKMAPVFKDFNVEFKKLAKGDVHFISEEGDKVSAAVKAAQTTGQRQNVTVHGYAVVPAVDPNEVVMEFTLTLSVKDLSQRPTAS